MRISAFFLLFLLISSVITSNAQEVGQDGNLLPDINPQDIEIRGNYRAQFPGLRRQPILGFDPKPRVYQLDPSRLPFIETREEVVANIPISTLAIPDSPPRVLWEQTKTASGLIYGGFGNRTNPEAGLIVGLHRKNQDALFVRSSLFSNGDLGFDYDADQFISSTTAGYTKIISPNVQWHTEINANYRDFFQPVNAGLTEEKRTGVYSLKTGFDDLRNPYHSTALFLEYGLDVMDEKVSNMGHRVALDYKRERPASAELSSTNLTLNAQAGWNDVNIFYDPTQNSSVQWFVGDLGWTYQRRVEFSNRLTWGASAAYFSDDQKSGVLIYPELKWEYWSSSTTEILVFLRGHVENKGLGNTMLQNRFWNGYEAVETERGWLFDAVYTKQLQSNLSWVSQVNAAYYTNFGYFDYSTTNTIVGQANPFSEHQLLFSGAQTAKFSTALEFITMEDRIAFSTEVYYLNNRLKNGDPIPYMEDAGLSASVSVFPKDGWRLTSDLRWVTGRDGEATNTSIFLWNSSVHWQFAQRAGAYIKVLNMTNATYTYWSDFNELPFYINGGISIIW